MNVLALRNRSGHRALVVATLVVGTVVAVVAGLAAAAPAGAAPGAAVSTHGTGHVRAGSRRATPAWTTAEVTPPRQRFGQLSGIGCTAGNGFCVAVGNGWDLLGSRDAYAVSRTAGNRWRLMPPLSPPRQSFYTRLDHVSCAAADDCVAVGWYSVDPKASAGARALAYAWNGSSWRRTPIPGSAHAVIRLADVSCAPAGPCMAIGSTDSFHRDLAYRWNGHRWTATRLVHGGRMTPLAALTCPGRSLCYAVGQNRRATTRPGLVERWDGTHWRTVRVAAGDVHGRWELTGVSCATRDRCTAIGDTLGRPPGDTFYPKRVLFATLDHGRWTTSTHAPPHASIPAPKSGFFAGTGAVSCRTATSCVGLIYAGVYRPRHQAVPVLRAGVASRQGHRTTFATLQHGFDVADVSCAASRRACLVLGTKHDGPTGVVRYPHPGRIVATPRRLGARASTTSGVSCADARHCLAVGSFSRAPLSLRSTGGRWSPVAVPTVPRVAGLQSLQAVSCASASSCVAVGERDLDGFVYRQRPIAGVWNGTRWRLLSAPYSTSRPARGAYFESVACVSARWCMATGALVERDNDEVQLAEIWNGKRWTISRTGPTPGSLNAVSCTSRSECVAIGPVSIERWNGSSWTAETPARTAGRSGLRGVSCAAGGACTIVGRAARDSWLVETSPGPGSAWTVAATGTGGVLTSVSCIAADRCAAVGSGRSQRAIGGRTFEVDHTLVVTGGGPTWRRRHSANPPGSGDDLESVTCVAGGACSAVGYAGWFNEVPLVLHGRI